MAALTNTEDSVLLAATQAALISCPEVHMQGSAPKMLSVGHNPYPAGFFDGGHIVLPSSTRRKTLVEYLYETSAEERAVKGLKKKKRLERSWVRAGGEAMKLTTHLYLAKGDTAPGVDPSAPYGLHLLAEDSLLATLARNASSMISSSGMREGSTSSLRDGLGSRLSPNDFNPHKVTAFMEGLSAREQKAVAAQRFTEYFYKSRVAVERWVRPPSACGIRCACRVLLAAPVWMPRDCSGLSL